MSSYRVSVITPVYNSEPYLNDAFHSLRKQTAGFSNIEWIVVDDHSTDGSYKKLRKWAAIFTNIKVYQTPVNSGSASAPRNIALDHVTAPYVMFLDADDMYENDAVAFLLSSIESNPVDLANAAFQHYVGRSKKGLEGRYPSRREGQYFIFQQNDEWFPISHPIVTKIFSTEIIVKHHLRFDENLRNGEDSLFLFEYMQKIESAWHSNHIIYNYRHREESVSHAHTKQYFMDLLSTYNTIRKTFLNSQAFVFYDKFVEISIFATMDILCDTFTIADKDCIDILKYWFPVLKYAKEKGFKADTAIGKILADDAGKNDFDAASFHFLALRDLYREKRTQLEEVFRSRGWKLLTAINHLLRR